MPMRTGFAAVAATAVVLTGCTHHTSATPTGVSAQMPTPTAVSRELCPGAWGAPLPQNPRARALVEKYEPTNFQIRQQLGSITAIGTEADVREELRRLKIAYVWSQDMIRAAGLALNEVPDYGLAEQYMKETRATFDEVLDRHLSALVAGDIPSTMTIQDRQIEEEVCVDERVELKVSGPDVD